MKKGILFLLGVLFSLNLSSQIYISEINANSDGTDMDEFVELAGPLGASLDGYILVFINGSNDNTYYCADLDGFILDGTTGTFLLGNASVPGIGVTFPDGTLQNGQDAIALIQLPSCPSNGTACSAILGTIADAILYGGTDVELTSCLGVNNAGSDSDGDAGAGETSLKRVDNTTWALSSPTDPGMANGTFVINTEVAFAAATSSVTEDGTSIDVCVDIADEDAGVATTVEVSLDLGSTATEGVGNDFTASPALTATLTFPAASNTQQCVTFTINDDIDLEGDEDIILNLGNPLGGNSAVLGAVTQHTLTIVDNEAPVCTYTTGGIYISELSYNPCGTQGSDATCEYVEIYNAYSNSVDITGWSINGFGYTFPAMTTIASGAYIAIGKSNNDCIDYDLAGLGVASGGLTNGGETLDVVDNCGNIISSVTYTNAFADGDCDAVGIDPLGVLSAVTPSPGVGSCIASADAYAPSCGITALGVESIACTNFTGGLDPVIVSIPYTGVDVCATITNNGAGTIGGDDITVTTDGTIEITLNEGDTWDIEITDSGCSGLTSTGTVSITECTASCGVDASASTATVNISSTTSAATVNTLDDAYVSSLEAACGAFELDMVYAAMSWDNAADGGNLDGLVITDGSSSGIPYSGIATYQIHEILQACAGTGNNGSVFDANSSNNIISTNENSMQGGSPKPDLIGPHFTENDGTSTGVNAICMNFTDPIAEISFWLGDVETSDVNPGYIHVYDAAGDVISSTPIPTETLLLDQAANCVGSTSGSGFSGCGNGETAFIEISAATAVISQICIEVGDFSDDLTDPAGSEHLSIGGVSLGGVCIDRDPLPVCTDLLAYQDFDGSINTWQYAASPAEYDEDGSTDLWGPRPSATGGTGSVSPQTLDNTYFWGLRDIENNGSGGAFEHTLIFEYDVSCYENVSVNFDYTGNGFEAADYLAYQIQDENGVDIVPKTNLVIGATVPWTQSANAIPNTVNAITLTLYARQNGDADSGGFDRIYICGTAIAAAPLTVGLDGSCGDNTGTITMDLSGGTGPYDISGDISTSIPAAGTGLVIADGMLEGTYLIIIEDNCGNMDMQNVTVDAPCALPVELLAFNAEKAGQHVQLTWSTASEINNDYFAIEYSNDGQTFREIGIVDGAGNSTEVVDYEYLHTTAILGNNYYRLRQVDYDGSVDYSDVRVVVFEDTHNENIISIRPTVSKNMITLVAQESFGQDASIYIINTTGQIAKELNLQQGTTSLEIKIDDLPPGHYFVKVVGGDLSFTNRFIKQ